MIYAPEAPKTSQMDPKGRPKGAKGNPKGDKGILKEPRRTARWSQRNPQGGKVISRGRAVGKGFVRRHRANDRFARREGGSKTERESGEGSYINKLPINRKAAIYL